MVQMSESTGELLRLARLGDRDAESKLVDHLYNDLKRMAAHFLAAERKNHTLQPTALVHEAYARLLGKSRLTALDRQHFFHLAGRTMRRVLVDSARHRNSTPARYLEPIGDLDKVFHHDPDRPARYIAIDEALERLAQKDPDMVKIVEMRFFAGLTEDEIAESLGVSRRTISREWSNAQAELALLLAQELSPPDKAVTKKPQ